MFVPASALGGGTITWVNGKTTSFVAKPLRRGGTACPAGSDELRWRGTVTADTTGSTAVPHPLRATLCHDSHNGNVTLAPGEKLVL
jgi:hypothetical protein